MRTAAAIAVFALVAVACGGDSGDTVVATVNEVEISRADVIALRTTPDDLVELDSEDFREELMSLIVQTTVETSLESEFGVVVEDAEIEAAVELALSQSGLTIEQAAAALEDPAATPERYRRVVESEILRTRASVAITTSGEFLDAIMEDIDLVSTVCVGHVLVESEAQALGAKIRLDSGESLSEVAGDISIDEGTRGGNLGCSPPARFVEAFADATLEAPVGEPFGPFETEFGWHVIVVDDRLVPTRQQIAADPQAYVPPEVANAEFTRWFNGMLRAADISVFAEVGTWFPDGPGILPPDDE